MALRAAKGYEDGRRVWGGRPRLRTGPLAGPPAEGRPGGRPRTRGSAPQERVFDRAVLTQPQRSRWARRMSHSCSPLQRAEIRLTICCCVVARAAELEAWTLMPRSVVPPTTRFMALV